MGMRLEASVGNPWAEKERREAQVMEEVAIGREKPDLI